MCGKYFLVCMLTVLHVISLQGKVIIEKVLQLSHSTKCTYDYEVTVNTVRGAKSTLGDGYQVHALVRYSFVTLRTKIANIFLFAMYRESHCQCRGNRLFISASFQKRRMKVFWAQNMLLIFQLLLLYNFLLYYLVNIKVFDIP